VAHEQDGHARRAHDSFGTAPHHQSGDAAAAVSAEHDEVGVPLFCLFNDRIGDGAPHCFQEHYLALDRVLFHLLLGLATIFLQSLRSAATNSSMYAVWA
jgi:hypothetical protein